MIRPITEQYHAPHPTDSARLDAVLDKMAEIERVGLGFLDPEYSGEYFYGADVPDQLPDGRFPIIIRYASERGVAFRSVMMGGTVGAHPGGKREHLVHIEVALLVARRKDNNGKQLSTRTLYWEDAYDQLWCANHRVDGLVKAIEVTDARWGPIDYARKWYWGWLFGVKILVQRLYEGGG
jgi:hypothetical protein